MVLVTKATSEYPFVMIYRAEPYLGFFMCRNQVCIIHECEVTWETLCITQKIRNERERKGQISFTHTLQAAISHVFSSSLLKARI